MVRQRLVPMSIYPGLHEIFLFTYSLKTFHSQSSNLQLMPFYHCLNLLECLSVQPLSHVWLFATPWTATCQAFLPITNIPNSCPLSWWCHLTISSSVVPFCSCLQSFPASGSFLMSQFFTSGGQSIGASASVLPMNIQEWFPLGLTGLISLHSKGISRVFSNTTVFRVWVYFQLAADQRWPKTFWSSTH